MEAHGTRRKSLKVRESQRKRELYEGPGTHNTINAQYCKVNETVKLFVVIGYPVLMRPLLSIFVRGGAPSDLCNAAHSVGVARGQNYSAVYHE